MREERHIPENATKAHCVHLVSEFCRDDIFLNTFIRVRVVCVCWVLFAFVTTVRYRCTSLLHGTLSAASAARFVVATLCVRVLVFIVPTTITEDNTCTVCPMSTVWYVGFNLPLLTASSVLELHRFFFFFLSCCSLFCLRATGWGHRHRGHHGVRGEGVG